MCSYAIIKRLGNTQQKKCYRWGTDEGFFEFIFPHFDNTGTDQVGFYYPLLEQNVMITIDEGIVKEHKYVYCFSNKNISMYGNYEITYFCPAIIQINEKKTTLTVIASHCCLNQVIDLTNISYSS